MARPRSPGSISTCGRRRRRHRRRRSPARSSRRCGSRQGAPALAAIELDAPASGHGRGPGRDRGGRRWPLALAAVVGAAAAAVAIVLATGRGGGASAPAALARRGRAGAAAGARAPRAGSAPSSRRSRRGRSRPPRIRRGGSRPGSQRGRRASARPAGHGRRSRGRQSRGRRSRPTEPGPEANPASLPGLAPPQGPAPRAAAADAGSDIAGIWIWLRRRRAPREGEGALRRGPARAAFAALEASYACRLDSQTAAKAFVAACNLPSIAKAAWSWRRMVPRQRQMALAVCVRNGITEDDLNRAASPQRTTGKP